MLAPLAECGFDGKIGLSIDKFHGMDTAKVVEFCRVTRKVFDRDNILSLSYASRHPDQGLEPVRALARCPRCRDRLVGRSAPLSAGVAGPYDDAELEPPRPGGAGREASAAAWDGTWFEEDYCEGPGQALIVNPQGEVKPCCGFASDLDQLTIGNIYHDTVKQVIQQGRTASLSSARCSARG